MPINETYRTWIHRICELRPKQRTTQVKNFVWLVVGIFHSRSVSLSQYRRQSDQYCQECEYRATPQSFSGQPSHRCA